MPLQRAITPWKVCSIFHSLLLSFGCGLWEWLCHMLIMYSDTLCELPSLKEEAYYSLRKKPPNVETNIDTDASCFAVSSALVNLV